MKITFFSTKPYEVSFFEQAKKSHYQLIFLTDRLTEHTALKASGSDVVCCFVEDQLDQAVLTQLSALGIKLIALRSSGFNHVDVQAAVTLKLTVVHVPSYSPHAIAEFALGMMLALSRKLFRGYERVQRHNFSLLGQMGFNLHNKTIGIVGTGAIGTVMAELLTGFGCTILAADPLPNERCLALGVIYAMHEDLYQRSDIITLHFCIFLPYHGFYKTSTNLRNNLI
jgi:D-lactate dehydrogenase